MRQIERESNHVNRHTHSFRHENIPPITAIPRPPPLHSTVLHQIHIHGSDLESLHKEVPKEILPAEYGGTNGTVEDIKSK